MIKHSAFWGKLKNHRGQDAEDTIRNILGIFKKQGLIFTYTKTRQYSIPDSNGVDFWVEFLTRDMKIKSFPLQVKSSPAGLATHRKKYKHPCIVVGKNTDKKLLKLIRGNCPSNSIHTISPAGCLDMAGIEEHKSPKRNQPGYLPCSLIN